MKRILLFLLAAVLMASPSAAVAIGFDCLTGNLAGDCAIGEAQLSVDVLAVGGSQVEFTFSNTGPDASRIAEIYFDAGTLLAITSVVDGSGVDFEQGADPPNLPGGNTAAPPFVVSAGLLAQSQPSTSQNGVGPGEFVTIILDGSFADVISELTTGELRIGIHVIAFDSGGSESFINLPIPEPGTALLLGAGLVGLALRRRACA